MNEDEHELINNILKNPKEINLGEHKTKKLIILYWLSKKFITDTKQRKPIINVILEIKNLDHGILLMRSILYEMKRTYFRRALMKFNKDTRDKIYNKYRKKLDKEWRQ